MLNHMRRVGLLSRRGLVVPGGCYAQEDHPVQVAGQGARMVLRASQGIGLVDGGPVASAPRVLCPCSPLQDAQRPFAVHTNRAGIPRPRVIPTAGDRASDPGIPTPSFLSLKQGPGRQPRSRRWRSALRDNFYDETSPFLLVRRSMRSLAILLSCWRRSCTVVATQKVGRLWMALL